MKFLNTMMIYKLNGSIDPEALERDLSAYPFQPCGSQDMQRTGWVSPDDSGNLAYCDGNQILLVAEREEKVIPAEQRRRSEQERFRAFEVREGAKPNKAQKDSMRDEVLHTLLPRAFTKRSQVRLIVDLNTSLIIVETKSAKRAEDTLALLRKSIGSLPVVPLTLETPIELTLTEWLKTGDVPAGYKLGEDAKLVDLLSMGGKVTMKDSDLLSDEVKQHIEAGKVVQSVRLDWQDRIGFTLNDGFVLSGIKFADSLLEQNDDIDRDDPAARFKADFILMMAEVNALVASLIGALGGVAKV